MEILIVGIIIVAVMAWASTRIKRTAKEAFEAENIETAEFTIHKPDGWLSIVSPKAPYLFEAYSKAFGKEPNEKVRLGTATVERSTGTIDEAASRFIAEGQVADDIREVVADVHYRVIELTRGDEADQIEWLKFDQADGSVYTLEIKVLSETTDQFRRDIETMIDSFQLRNS